MKKFQQAFSDSIALISCPNIPKPLISTRSFEQILELSSIFPARGVSTFGYECLLGDDRAKADFLFCLSKHTGGPEILAGRDEFDTFISDALLKKTAWQHIRRFALAWDNSDERLHAQVKNVWFEFDMDSIQRAAPIPSFFFGLEEQGDADARDSLKELAQEIFALLQVDVNTGNIFRKFCECVDSLPDDAFVFQVGAMLSRPNSPLRLCIRGIDSEKTAEYLSGIGWQGSIEGLNKLLIEVEALSDHTRLDLDVMSVIGPKVGIECYFDPGHLSVRLPRFIDYLHGSGLCTGLEKEALLGYGGILSDVANDAWPLHLSRGSAFSGNRRVSAYVLDYNHFKLVYESGQKIKAKAYLRSHPVWLSQSQLREMLK